MATLFCCPDCNATYEEPLEADFAIGVRCADCQLEFEVIAWQTLDSDVLLSHAA